ncbi:hypothetical protein PFISCL1PPCAC_8329, partial [Pristionchus fissidentatus]
SLPSPPPLLIHSFSPLPMRSSTYFGQLEDRSSSRKRKNDRFVVGPILYKDNTAADASARSRRPNRSFTAESPGADVGSLTFRSPSNSSKSTKSKKVKKSESKSSTKSKSLNRKKEKRCQYPDDDCPIKKREADAQLEKSYYEKVNRAKIIEMSKRAEKDYEKLLVQRSQAQQKTREIESSMNMEEDSRNRSMAMISNKLEGMQWRTSRDVKDVKREIGEWKEKVGQSGELAMRVDIIEKRVEVLEKAESERKRIIDLVDKNWSDFARLRTQSMALEITQIKSRRGAIHLSKMPEDVAKTTAKNLYSLCSNLNKLIYHLHHTSEQREVADEALTLAEAIASLFGPKLENNMESRDSTSCTNVSMSKLSLDSSSSVGGSEPTTPTKPSAVPPRQFSPSVTVPPSAFGGQYKRSENLYIDAPSLREKSSNYYSDKDFTNATKAAEIQANCEPNTAKEGPTITVSPSAVAQPAPVVPVVAVQPPAAPAAALAAAPPTAPIEPAAAVATPEPAAAPAAA